MPQTKPLFERLDMWMEEIGAAKTASAKPKKTVKKAGPSGMGDSSHPTDDVDDNTQEPDTGSRYTENSEDVKKDVPGQAVDETDKGSGGSQDDKQFNIGTNQSAVGEDPSVEDDYKSDKDDPGTDHPANTDDTGEKYSSVTLPNLLKLAEKQANALLADFASSLNSPTPVKQAASKPVTQQPQKPLDTAIAATNGYVTADYMNKLAEDFIAKSIQDADLDADLVGAYLHAKWQKQAEDELPPEEGVPGDGMMPPMDPSMMPPPGAEGGMPPEAGGGGGDVLAALGAGGAGGGEPPPPEEGGGGNMSEEQALQELVAALEELGISPEELAAMAEAPQAPPGAAEEGQKLASAAKKFKRSGKYSIHEAKTAQQKNARQEIKNYIREITGLRQ